MSIATFNKFNSFVYNLGTETYNFSTDVLKLALTNTLPLATNTVLANITEITAANGYTAGGIAVTTVSYTQSAGTMKLIVSTANPAITATGGSLASFRYYVIYDTTSPSSALIGWWDFGSVVTLTVGQTWTPTFDQTNGILQAA